jgi:hypothetical protein
MARDSEHFFTKIVFFCPFRLLPMRTFFLFQGPTTLFIHWFGGSLVFEFFVYYGYQSFVWCIASKYFLLLCGWSLQFREHFFCCAELFNFMQSHLSIFSLSWWAAGVLLTKSLPIPVACRVFLALSCTNFKVLGLILRSLIHFQLILVQGDRHGSSFSFLQADNHFSQKHLLKRL